MTGAAPTDFQFTKTLDAVPVHCSVCLGGQSLISRSPTNEHQFGQTPFGRVERPADWPSLLPDQFPPDFEVAAP
jgi:hypothetical protein